MTSAARHETRMPTEDYGTTKAHTARKDKGLQGPRASAPIGDLTPRWGPALARQRRLHWLLLLVVLTILGTVAFFIYKNASLAVVSLPGGIPSGNPGPATGQVPKRANNDEPAGQLSPREAQRQQSSKERGGHESAMLLTGKVVCLDPGHPSENNSGRTLQNGVTELEVNWDVALRLRAYLEQAGVRVVMTKRTMDEYVTNRERAEIANTSGAALFYRIHADTGTHSGVTSYYPAQPGQKDGVRGPSSAVSDSSSLAAEIIHAGIVEAVCPPLRNNGVRTDRATYIGRRQGALTGSIFSQVPTVLTEMCVLSSKTDAEFIKGESGQSSMARGMANGILQFLARHDESTTAP